MTMNETGRVMALDVGTATIGVAVSDAMRMIAQPLETIRRTEIEDDMQRLAEIISEQQIALVVIGLPKRLDGSHGDMADTAKDIGKRIWERWELKVKYWDERFSTQAAERALLEGNVRRSKRKKIIDQTAAVWILQGFLDRHASI